MPANFNHPINLTSIPYPTYNDVVFPNTVSPNARGRATPIPLTTYGNTTIPQFNKAAANAIPSAVMVIRGLIRGNTS